jgi:hypothetical protein
LEDCPKRNAPQLHERCDLICPRFAESDVSCLLRPDPVAAFNGSGLATSATRSGVLMTEVSSLIASGKDWLKLVRN